MAAPSLAWAWDEHTGLAFLLEHHPVLQAQRAAHAAEKLLNHLPVIEALLSERDQAAANLETAAANATRARAAANERTAAAQTAVDSATTAQERVTATKALSNITQTTAADVANADAALERARTAAEYEAFNRQRRYALAELGQLRRRLAEQAARRFDEETRTNEIRQAALSGMAKLRELEAERTAADTRLGFLKSKSAWLQQQVAQGQPETDLWEHAQRQNAETAALKRLDLLIEAQRQQVAHLAGDRWETLYRYLAGAAP